MKPLVLSLAALLTLSACGSDTTPVSTETDVLVQCYAIWFGALPDYEGQSVTIRACLNESTCSEEHELTATSGSHRYYDDFYLSAAFDPEGHHHGNDPENEIINLSVSLFYMPEFAATLGDEDRATLLVKAEDGSIMMEIVSEVPYLDDVRTFRDGDVLCKSVYLRPDGTARPLPVSDPEAPPPTR